jgi:mono/diheme cytochrome c family protein
MDTGRTPATGARRRPSGRGGFSLSANLPYLVVIGVSLVVLVGFIALADPFSPGEGRATDGTTTTAATGSGITTTSTAGATSTTAPGSTPASTSVLTGAARGEEIFNSTCIACHGVGGVGIDGLGKDLTTSTFIAGLTDDELVAFLVVGRPESDPLNTTGMEMPARGGNTSLTDDDLRAVVAYLRDLAA